MHDSYDPGDGHSYVPRHYGRSPSELRGRYYLGRFWRGAGLVVAGSVILAFLIYLHHYGWPF